MHNLTAWRPLAGRYDTQHDTGTTTPWGVINAMHLHVAWGSGEVLTEELLTAASGVAPSDDVGPEQAVTRKSAGRGTPMVRRWLRLLVLPSLITGYGAGERSER